MTTRPNQPMGCCVEVRMVIWFLVVFASCLAATSHIYGQETWIEIHKLVAWDGGSEDTFGSSVALDGSIAVIGAPLEDVYAEDSGAAYVFDVVTGAPIAKLSPGSGTPQDRFGTAVDLSGDVAIVGGNGAAYLFNVQTGQLLRKLTRRDGGTNSHGNAVAIEGDIAVVGASHLGGLSPYAGSAVVYDVLSGVERFTLIAPDGDVHDHLGTSVAISGNTIAVGADSDDERALDGGAVYLFDAVTGDFLRKLMAGDGSSFDLFGRSVAIEGNALVVGAPRGDNPIPGSGSAYLFDADDGIQVAKLSLDEIASGDNFGWSVGVSSGLITVGAYGHASGPIHSGAAYVFDASSAAHIGTLVASDPETGDELGYSVSTSGGRVIAGAHRENTNGFMSGAAYVFERSCMPLSPPAGIPGPPGTQTQYRLVEADFGSESGWKSRFVQSPSEINWTRPTVLLVHGWRDSSEGIFVTHFLDVAFGRPFGVFAGRSDAQIVAIDWRDRALQSNVDSHGAWISARNGFADGQVAGIALAQLHQNAPLNLDRLHVVAHSNGSAFGVGMSSAFVERSGDSLRQMTVLDPPSENSILQGLLLVPPTGWLVYEHRNTIWHLDNWIAAPGSGYAEFGDLLGSDRAANLVTHASITDGLFPGEIVHSEIALRYGRSADVRYTQPQYPSTHREPGAFVLRSVVVGAQPLPPGSIRERPIQSRSRWNPLNTDRHPVRRLSPIPFASDPFTWRGVGVCATGDALAPDFYFQGRDLLCLELTIESDFGEALPLDLLRWTIDLAAPAMETLHLYVRSDAEQLPQYVGSFLLAGQSGDQIQCEALLTNEGGPVTATFVLESSGSDDIRFRLNDLELFVTDFKISE